jgi:hypothetical protein
VDVSGNNLINAPDWSGHIGVQYTFGLARFGDLTARVQGYFTDDIFLRALNLDPYDIQDSYSTWDTPPLPDDFPPLQVLVSIPEAMEPGFTLFNIRPAVGDSRMLVIVDELGDVVWYADDNFCLDGVHPIGRISLGLGFGPRPCGSRCAARRHPGRYFSDASRCLRDA